MPIFGNKIDILVGASGSTSSLEAINFIYTNPNYGSGIASASLGSLRFNNLNEDNRGAAGILEFRLASPEDAASRGKTMLSVQATGSNSTPLVGIGLTENQTPLGTLDIRSTTGSEPANLILRTNEDGFIDDGEETGRIIFAIESSSFSGSDDFLRSGSTAEIFSRVQNANDAGEAYGNLIVQVNDADSRTTPVDILELGYGASDYSQEIPAAKISGSLDARGLAPYVYLSDPAGNTIGFLGHSGSITASMSASTTGLLELYDNFTTSSFPQVFLNAGGDSWISSSYEVGIGTRSPIAKLHVAGNIYATGSITGSAISASGNIELGNRIGKGTTYIDFNTSTSGEIKFVNLNTGSVVIKDDGRISSSFGILASASLNPGSYTVVTYNTASGEFFYTSSADVGAGASTPNLQQVTSQGTITTAAITASIFTASTAIIGTLIGSPTSAITASSVSASGTIFGTLVGSPTSNITASVISASNISASSFRALNSGENLGGYEFQGFRNYIYYQEGEQQIHVAINDSDSLVLGENTSSAQGSFKAFRNFEYGGYISGSGNITASGYMIQDSPAIASSSAGVTFGANTNITNVTGEVINLLNTTSASLFRTSNTASLAHIEMYNGGTQGAIAFAKAGRIYSPAPGNLSLDASGSNTSVEISLHGPNRRISFSGTVRAEHPISGSIVSGSDSVIFPTGSLEKIQIKRSLPTPAENGIFFHGNTIVDGAWKARIHEINSVDPGILRIDVSGSNAASEIEIHGEKRQLTFNGNIDNADFAITSSFISASNTIEALTGSYSALIASPTASGDPQTLGIDGVDGQMLAGTVGGVHYVYVYMANRWRSSSLA